MGLFSKKEAKLCSFCGEKAGLLHTDLRDGCICQKCRKQKVSANLAITKQHSTADISKHIDDMQQRHDFMLHNFINSKVCGSCFAIDEQHKKFYIGNVSKIPNNPDLYDFDQLIDYELVEDGGIITQGGAGLAAAGGFLFGATGAIVGSNAGKKKSQPTVSDLHIRISLNDPYVHQAAIHFISAETKKSSVLYKVSKDLSESVVSLLDAIAHSNNSNQQSTPDQATPSVADEIVKLKALLDSGVLSQDEFDAAKKRLLDI